MATPAKKPTKAQMDEAKIRAAASGIKMNQSAKGLRNASKTILKGAAAATGAAGAAVTVARNAIKKPAPTRAVGTMKKLSTTAKPKATAKATAKPKPKASAMPKGEAAAKQYQKEISPKGMASASAAQSKALDKKYPGLYKKSK